MMSGFERYYQFARCFRDEDLRADRQPEFTQLDIETAFLDEAGVMELMEEMLRTLFKSVLNVELPKPFPRLTYAEAMRRYASDKPDLRNPLELVDVADLVKSAEFKVFAGPANNPAGRVAALRVPKGGELPRSQIDDYTAFVGGYGAKGLAYIKVNDVSKGRDGLQSPILKFLPDEAIAGILARTAAQNGDLIFFGADTAKVVNDALGALRLKLGQDLKLSTGEWKPLWIVDFPMFEYDPQAKRWVALHHPFTAPKVQDEALVDKDPANVTARAYDMVLNGSEIGGGSIRIHRTELQERVLAVLGIEHAEAHAKFGFLLEALKLGAPPHGGIAFGLDRICAIIAGTESIRDVIAFPQDPEGLVPAHGRPQHRQRRAVARVAHPRAPAPDRAGQAGLSFVSGKGNVGDPGPAAARDPFLARLVLEVHVLHAPGRGLHALGGREVHDAIQVPVDVRQDDWHHAALPADLRLGGTRAEAVIADHAGIADFDRQPAGGIGGVKRTVLGAERAGAAPHGEARRPGGTVRDASGCCRSGNCLQSRSLPGFLVKM